MTGPTVLDDLTTGDVWADAHDRYLETQLHRVRLLAHRQHAQRHADATARTADRYGGTPRSDGTSTELTGTIERHEARLRDLESELRSLGAPPGPVLLGEVAGLSPLEVEVVVCALAYELDAAVGSSFARLIGGDGSHPLSAAVATELFGLTATEAASLTSAGSPLHRFRLLAPTDGRLPAVEWPLRLEPRVTSYVRGVNALDERLDSVAGPMPALPVVHAHRDVAERLTDWLTSPDRSFDRPRINLIGPREQGREAIASAVAHAVGMHALRLDVERLLGRPDRLDLARLVSREGLLLPAAVYVDVPDTPGKDPGRAVAIAELIDALEGLLLIASDRRWAPSSEAFPIRVPLLDHAGRVALWGTALAPAVDLEGADLDADRLAQQFSFGPAHVVRVVEEARITAEMTEPNALTGDGLWSICRDVVGGDLGLLAQRIEPSATWDRLVLPDAELEVLRQIVAQVAQRTTVYEIWGLGTILHRGRGISALFTGPPGTGKTMSAEIMASELALDLYRVDLSSVVSKYIGETEKNLRRVFDAADRAGALLLFDEADALFGKRTEVRDSHDRHANVEINYLLQRMEDYAGLAILATNRKSDLDPAFLRRIRFLVSFPFPRPEYRRRIWQTVLPPETPRDELDLEALGRLELAGGNIRNVAVNGAFMAASAGESLSMAHLMRAAAHEYRKLDKLPTRAEFGSYHEEVRP